MKSEDEVKIYVHKMVDKGWRNPSAITLCANYEGFDWRFDKMRAFVEQEIKNYTQELLRSKK